MIAGRALQSIVSVYIEKGQGELLQGVQKYFNRQYLQNYVTQLKEDRQIESQFIDTLTFQSYEKN